ncbi:Aste57867_12740 [Aphanomyces stellatus]|uniref:Aste57867_12740 protein n=1 Tax=Aphanomyces stellatus TaxID=120398 RepID=A0A485KX12_9STRA|nr:hypothetical protein As57867_012692 [Aphanomyces stellatus]VFT89590.1 Aste57867_12740 [Aphanomyces stellatus]
MPRQRRQWAFQADGDGPGKLHSVDELGYSAREILYDAKEATRSSSESATSHRVKQRQRMRDYRHALALEAKYLALQVQELETQLLELTKRNRRISIDSCLPWREVATALHEAAVTATDERDALKAHVRDTRHLHNVMKAWVLQHHRGPMRSPSAAAALSTWQHTHLLAHEPSRRLGFEWITNQMFHHTSAILEQCAFPPLVDSIATTFLDIHFQRHDDDDGGYTMIQRHQTLFHTSLATATAILQALYLKQTIGVGVTQDLDTSFLHDSGRYSRQNSEGNHFIHFLRRVFTVDDRQLVIVGRNVLGDDKYPVGDLVRNGLAWIVVREIAPNCVLYQNYFVCEQLHTPAGQYITLADDAANKGLTLTEMNDERMWREFERAAVARQIQGIQSVEARLHMLFDAKRIPVD